LSDLRAKIAKYSTYLIGGFSYGDRRADICRPTTVNDTIVLDEVSDCTDRVVKRPFRLVDDLKPQ
jgi:hypothetical protein